MYKVVFSLVVFTTPFFVSADATEQATAQAASFVAKLNSIILFPTIGLLSAVALLIFIFGCFQYIALSGNDQARAQGVKHITWGIVGLVVMLSAFAILSIVTASFGLDDELNCARNPDASGCGGVVVPVPDRDTTGPIIPVGDRDTTGSVTPDGDRDDTGPIMPEPDV